MSEFPPRDPNETQQFSAPGSGGPLPPSMTQPIYVPPQPSRGRNLVIALLVLLIGATAGFAGAQLMGHRNTQTPDANTVLYENASLAFPIDGGAFTASTFDSANKQCDKELLKQFLRADPRRFRAWLDLEQISSAEFDSFVDRLQTQILDKPTPVTNHGCFQKGACPFAFQSVLGAGTPVLFDPQQGRIVAKCLCSSPLTDPRCPPNCEDTLLPSPTPLITETPTEAPTPSPSATPTASPSPTPEATETPKPTESPSPSPSPSPTKTPKRP